MLDSLHFPISTRKGNADECLWLSLGFFHHRNTSLYARTSYTQTRQGVVKRLQVALAAWQRRWLRLDHFTANKSEQTFRGIRQPRIASVIANEIEETQSPLHRKCRVKQNPGDKTSILLGQASLSKREKHYQEVHEDLISSNFLIMGKRITIMCALQRRTMKRIEEKMDIV